MDYRRIESGQRLWRKSFRWASFILPICFTLAASYAVFDGFLNSDPDAFKAAGMILAVGAVTLRFTRSRIHLMEGGVIAVNPIFWYSVPWSEIRKADATPGSGLVIHTKKDFRGEPEIFTIGFAGSLLDRKFQTAGKAAKEINRTKKKQSRIGEAEPEISYGVVRDLAFEAMAILAAACFAVSFLIG